MTTAISGRSSLGTYNPCKYYSIKRLSNLKTPHHKTIGSCTQDFEEIMNNYLISTTLGHLFLT